MHRNKDTHETGIFVGEIAISRRSDFPVDTGCPVSPAGPGIRTRLRGSVPAADIELTRIPLSIIAPYTLISYA
jgi:hypothetical protein